MTAAEALLASGDVTWEGNETGLAPYLTPTGDDAVARLAAADAEPLRQALTDPGRFVLAHIGLTRLTEVEHESFPRWNGLKVAIDSHGQAEVEPEQRVDLARRWDGWFDSEPRPSRLPE